MEVSLAQAVARLQEIDKEYAARQQRMAALGAETDQILESIKRSLANIERLNLETERLQQQKSLLPPLEPPKSPEPK